MFLQVGLIKLAMVRIYQTMECYVLNNIFEGVLYLKDVFSVITLKSRCSIAIKVAPSLVGLIRAPIGRLDPPTYKLLWLKLKADLLQ